MFVEITHRRSYTMSVSELPVMARDVSQSVTYTFTFLDNLISEMLH